jgi:putative nucleotidyltransferase with HDIG domain
MSAERSDPTSIYRRVQALVEEGRLELPLLPEVCAEILAQRDDTYEPRRLADLIRRDQSLAGHLLRIANSALYLPQVPIVSLQQAISRLGFLAIRQITLLIAVQGRAFSVPGHEASVRALFQHALATALCAQEIARLRRLSVDEAFLCGLLHDLGRVVLWQALLDLPGGAALPAPARAEILDGLHAQAGAALVQRWALPGRLAETVRHHHQPGHPEAPKIAPLIALADDLARFMLPLSPASGDGGRAVSEEAIRRHPALAALQLYPDDVTALLGRREGIARTVEAF